MSQTATALNAEGPEPGAPIPAPLNPAPPIPASPIPASPGTSQPERPIWPALRKGWRRRCPNCGNGPMLRSYLKVRDNCPVCHEELFHHRADDGPPYLTILLVGHVMAPLLLIVFNVFRPEPIVLFTIFSLGCTIASLYLLPRLKGMIVAFQWARYMHGFGHSHMMSSDATDPP